MAYQNIPMPTICKKYRLFQLISSIIVTYFGRRDMNFVSYESVIDYVKIPHQR